jgi:hypothetical protein
LSVSETVVDLAAAGGEPFAIREVRNGATRYRDDLQSAMGGLTLNLPPC